MYYFNEHYFLIMKIIVWGSKYPEKYCVYFENKTTEEDRSVPAFLFCELTMNILMHAVLSVAFRTTLASFIQNIFILKPVNLPKAMYGLGHPENSSFSSYIYMLRPVVVCAHRTPRCADRLFVCFLFNEHYRFRFAATISGMRNLKSSSPFLPRDYALVIVELMTAAVQRRYCTFRLNFAC